MPAAVRNKAVRLLTLVYVGLNDTRLTEKLRKLHGLTVDRESVRRLHRTLGLPNLHEGTGGFRRTAPARPAAHVAR